MDLNVNLTVSKSLIKICETILLLQETKSTTEKQNILLDIRNILQDSPEQETATMFHYVMKHLLDNRIVTNIAKKKFSKITANDDIEYKNVLASIKDHVIAHDNELDFLFYETILYLQDNKCSGTDDNIAYVKARWKAFKAYPVIQKVLMMCITKSEALGVSVGSYNKANPDKEIFEMTCQLAEKFEDRCEKMIGEEYYITEKFDGFRCLAFVENNKVSMFTRNGKLYTNFIDIENALEKLGRDFSSRYPHGILFDGELIGPGNNAAEQYKNTSKIVTKKDGDRTGVKFHIFDIVGLKDDNTPYCQRRLLLNKLDTDLSIQKVSLGNDHYLRSIKIVELLGEGVIDENNDKLFKLLDTVSAQGKEGLMINIADAPYQFKRNKGLLKMKKMNTIDCRIVDFKEGQGKLTGTLGSLVVNFLHENVEYSVDVPGFTDEMRDRIWNNKELYLNKICEVNYFTITCNKDLQFSLRFPRFKCMRFDKDSY